MTVRNAAGSAGLNGLTGGTARWRQQAGAKVAPPEQTNAENFYYQKQMQTRTPMVIVLRDGEEVHGIIEWYDKTCIKVVREGSGHNLVIYKPAIKYMFKEERERPLDKLLRAPPVYGRDAPVDNLPYLP